ncbi:MAG: tRNA pseudouridine(55) synthase TruB [Gemmataceae bacterium]
MSGPQGFLVIDKPLGVTSRRAVDVVQTWFPKGTRIGHAGTLDPLATGVLVVAVGRATRLIEYVQRMEKEYATVLELGATSATDDAEGPITPTLGAAAPAPQDVDEAVRSFVGVIDQIPPAFSAAKVAGRRAHRLARRGEEVELAPRRVTIHDIRLLRYEYPALELIIRCGKGTYIRSLARDLGHRLDCGAYVRALRRNSIGPFSLHAAISLESPRQEASQHLLPLEAGLPAARVELPPELIARLAVGQAIEISAAFIPLGAEEVAVFDPARRFRALAAWDPATGKLQPTKVFQLE